METDPEFLAPKAIVKDSTRILTLREYEKLKTKLEPNYICIFDAMFHTGMRMSEFRAFAKHPEWYDARRRCIELTTEAIKKKKTVYKTRQVTLTVGGCKAVEHFIKMTRDNLKIPSRQAMLYILCKAAREAELPDGDRGMCPKQFRKMLVSMLMKTYPEKMFEIASSMGHTLEVMRTNYTNMTFAKEDYEDIRAFFKGWGEG